MAHPVFARIGGSPLGRAGLATVSILALAGLAAGGLPLTCKLAPAAAFCAGGAADHVVLPVDEAAVGPHPAAEAAPLSATEGGDLTADSAPASEPKAAAKQVALLEQTHRPTLTNNDLVAATFEALNVELSVTPPGELTARKVRTVTINADGSVAGMPSDAMESPVPDASTVAVDETLVADAAEEPASAETPAEATTAPVADEVVDDESSTSLAYAPASGDGAIVKGGGVNVRSLPQKGGSEVLYALEGGAEVTIVEMRKGWAKVVDARGRSGWVYGEFLIRG